jgi:hypothetical protein
MLTSSSLGTLPPDRAGKVTAISWIAAAFFGVLGIRYAWAVLKPGMLIISPTGISQDLGWRRRQWRWADIDQIEVQRTAANLMSLCVLYPKGRRPVRLFGWELSPEELHDAIERERATQTPR